MRQRYKPPGYHYLESNFNGFEMKMAALYSKELSMQQSHDMGIVHVYNLYYQKEGARPTAIPFSSLVNLKKHVGHVLMVTDTLEPPFKAAVKRLLTQATTDASEALDRIVITFRTAQATQEVPLGFDMWWEEEPQVLL